MEVWSLASLRGLKIQPCCKMRCGFADAAQIWRCCGLWRPAAPVPPLAWELSNATGVAIKKKKKEHLAVTHSTLQFTQHLYTHISSHLIITVVERRALERDTLCTGTAISCLQDTVARLPPRASPASAASPVKWGRLISRMTPVQRKVSWRAGYSECLIWCLSLHWGG